MKKIVIGLGVLGIYVLYSLGIRHQNPILAKPASLSNGNGASAGSGGSSVATNNSNSSTSGGASASTASNGNQQSSATSSNSSAYKDGTYTGAVENVYYGNVQVAVTISGGKITNVKFLQYPNSHYTSVYINQQAMPYLQQEALHSQNSNVQVISGATFTSQGFIQSMQSALARA